MEKKFEILINNLKLMSNKGICIAFSGGVDSCLLTYICKEFNITAITINTPFQTKEEINNCIEFCQKYNIKHKIININTLENEIISNNPIDRCYHCKKTIFSVLKNFCKNENIEYILDGTNADDINVYRPGLKALKELNILSPFLKHNITKNEIRAYSKLIGLKTYNQPSMPCMATRFPYNTKLTAEKIETVKKGENILKNIGFFPVRLRLYNDLARIETEKNKFNEFILNKETIIKELKKLGIKYITLDIEGLRSGSMDL